MTQAPVQEAPEGVALIIHVQPGASRTEYVGTHGSALKFRVAAPPVEGAANEALCAYLAEQFGLPKCAIKVSSGRGARRKRVSLTGVTGQRAREVFPHRSPAAEA